MTIDVNRQKDLTQLVHTVSSNAIIRHQNESRKY